MKKILMLATMAVAAVAFAAPAAAQAEGHFTHEGNPIDGTKTTNLTGTIKFSTPEVGSFSCEAHPEASIGTLSGTVTNLNITTNTCIGTGALKHCVLINHSLTTGTSEDHFNTLTPTPEAGVIDLKNLRLTNVFATAEGEVEEGELPCALRASAVGPIELQFANIELEVDNADPINEVTAIRGAGAVVSEVAGPIAVALAGGGPLSVVESETIGMTDT